MRIAPFVPIGPHATSGLPIQAAVLVAPRVTDLVPALPLQSSEAPGTVLANVLVQGQRSCRDGVNLVRYELGFESQTKRGESSIKRCGVRLRHFPCIQCPLRLNGEMSVVWMQVGIPVIPDKFEEVLKTLRCLQIVLFCRELMHSIR
jgi:hypothetical protein